MGRQCGEGGVEFEAVAALSAERAGGGCGEALAGGLKFIYTDVKTYVLFDLAYAAQAEDEIPSTY